MPGRLVLLRHAQSEWNAEGLWQGQADPVLSPEGHRQAAAGAKVLAGMGLFDVLFSSDLSRAEQTASALRDALDVTAPLEIDPGLREYDVGEWSGKTRAEIEERWPGDIARFGQGELVSPPGGETRHGFDRRVADAAERVARSASAMGARAVIVVTHGGVIRAIARLAGVADYRVGHLAGWLGRFDSDGLRPAEPVDLVELAAAADWTAAG